MASEHSKHHPLAEPIAMLRDEALNAPALVISASPVVLPAPGRGEDLLVRVSAPAVGSQLPIIVFAHGFGSSMDGYAPLANYWAARGFVVIQPTFLDSRRLGLPPDDSRRPSIWRIRVADDFQATRECKQRQQLEDIFSLRVRPPLLYLDGIAIPH